ncbi:MAG: tryptophan 2,3-dioxygenase [Cyanobacteria bacterium]|nr:tryptophan 2,3-dioxygenase [Cyanobacteriota bacterium]
MTHEPDAGAHHNSPGGHSESGHSHYYPIDFPIGEGKTDYEKYLRTVELLTLQKPDSEAVSPDELLFQVTHQASELWMKQMLHEIDRAVAAMKAMQLEQACRSFRLIAEIQMLLTHQVDMLGRHLSIWEYGKIRTALGQGSGMESPGFNRLLKTPKPIWDAFSEVIASQNISLNTLYRDYTQHLNLHALAECLVTYDDLFHKWRTHHMDLVCRTIGLDSNSLKGIPTKVLQRGVLERFFPELFEIRNQLTNESKLAYGGQPLNS